VVVLVAMLLVIAVMAAAALAALSTSLVLPWHKGPIQSLLEMAQHLVLLELLQLVLMAEIRHSMDTLP
jgi:hypothetical protein